MLGRFVVVLSLLLSPPLAVAVMTATTSHLEKVVAAEAAERFPARAILLEDAQPTDAPPSEVGDVPDLPAPARAVWTGPDGTARTGTVAAPPGTPTGASVQVWLDRDGDITRAPRDPAGIPGSAAAAGVFALLGVPFAVWCLYAVLRVGLDAHRARRWEEAWAQVEPDWHSRLL
jgi:hypothetical protein